MSNGSDLIVFIMARGGSTRVPMKNIAPIGDRTVVSFTLEDVQTLQQQFPGASCVLMTDHDAIADAVAMDKHCPTNYEVVRQTPEESRDSQEWLGIRRVLLERETRGVSYLYVMLLGADHVLRSSSLLGDAYLRIRSLQNENLMVQSAISVPARYHPYRIVTNLSAAVESIRWEQNIPELLSQQYPACYAVTGGVFIVRRSRIGSDLNIIEKQVHALPTDMAFEIDTPEDLTQARQLLSARSRTARQLKDLKGLFTAEEVTIVGSGNSTVDYQSAVRTEHVVLVNYALALAPILKNHKVYHVSLHSDIFCSDQRFGMEHVTPIIGEWGRNLVSPQIASKAVFYSTRQFADLDEQELATYASNASRCLTANTLCHVANSSHCAIHFIWLLGCRRLRIIGASEFKGAPTYGYDSRLAVPEQYTEQTTPATYYIDSFRRFVGLFNWDDVVTMGY